MLLVLMIMSLMTLIVTSPVPNLSNASQFMYQSLDSQPFNTTPQHLCHSTMSISSQNIFRLLSINRIPNNHQYKLLPTTNSSIIENRVWSNSQIGIKL